MLQYRQADPSHVDHEGRRLHSEARAPAGVVSGLWHLWLVHSSTSPSSRFVHCGDERRLTLVLLNGVFNSKAYQPVTYTWM